MNRLLVQRITALLILVGIAGIVVISVQNTDDKPKAVPKAEPAPVVADDLSREEADARQAFIANQRDGMAALRLTRVLRKRQKYAEAEQYLAMAGRLGVLENDGRKEAVLLMATRDWPAQMEGMFQRVVKDNPQDTELLYAVAKSYSAKGRGGEADKLLTQLLAIDPKNWDWRYERGVARMRAADYEPAVEDLRPVVDHDPNNYQARLYLANSLLGDARMADALKELQICHTAKPDAIDPLVGLAKCALEANDLDRAEQILTRAAQLEPTSIAVLQEQATLDLRRQRTESAIVTLKKILAIDPNHRTAHLQLSQSLLAIGKAEESRIHEQRYQELDRIEEQRLLKQRGMR